MNKLSFWDYITLGTTLIVICAYIVMRVMKALDRQAGGGGCSGCSKGGCNTSMIAGIDNCHGDGAAEPSPPLERDRGRCE